jgi:hypothetical protein
MAKALQCPSCGATTRLDAVPDSGAVACESCGQTMKVPPGLARRSTSSGGGSAPAPPARSSNGPEPAPAAPAPPRRARTRTPTAAPAAAGAAAGGTAVLSQGAAPAPASPRATATPSAPPIRPSGQAGAPARDDRGGREALPLWLRISAWVLALPLGLLIVGVPARQLDYLSSQKLLDVIVKRDLGRFLPIVVIIALWALVSALLVTLFVEGGRRWMLRRRRKKAKSRPTGVDALNAPPRRKGLLHRKGARK